MTTEFDEFESIEHDRRWMHGGGRRDDGRWALSVVDEFTQTTITYLADATQLAQLVVWGARQLAKAATKAST